MLRDKAPVWLYGRADAIDRCFAKRTFTKPDLVNHLAFTIALKLD